MRAELTLSASTLFAFLLVLARLAGAFVFVPLPAKDAGPTLPRIVLALAATLALFPRWPAVDATQMDVGGLIMVLISEMALGTSIGLMVSFIAEALTLGAQILSFQAGYTYASAIDPTTGADSDVIPVLAQLMAGLLFFTTGLHRFVISAFADSLERYPPGNFTLSKGIVQAVIRLGSDLFSMGLRLALPVLALLLMGEIALAVLGRINSQLQLGHHAFPAKMMLALATLTTALAVAPALYESYASDVMQVIRHSFGH